MDHVTTWQKVGSGYQWIDNWAGHDVKAEISRLVSKGQDSLKAQVCVWLDDVQLVRAHPTLTSMSSMRDFCRLLEDRRKATDYGINWRDWAEELAGRTLDAHRQGQPEVAVSDLWDKEIEQDTWLVEPYILESKSNVIYGDPGTAKSMMALQWAALMDTGHVNSQLKVVTRRANVLYLDYETDETEILHRLKWLHAGMEITVPSNVVYRYCTQPLVVETDYILDLIERRWGGDDTPIVIMVDSMGLATGGKLVDEEMVISYFAALRVLGSTSLTITHTNKDGHLFGSQYTLAAARNLWEVKRSAVTRGQIDVGLFHRKSNSVGKEVPRAYRLNFTPDPTTGTTQSVNIVAKDPIDTDFAREMSVAKVVLHIIETEGPTSKDALPKLVAEFKEAKEDGLRAAVKTAISRFCKAHKLVEKDGMIQMPPTPTTPSPQVNEKPGEKDDLWTTQF